MSAYGGINDKNILVALLDEMDKKYEEHFNNYVRTNKKCLSHITDSILQDYKENYQITFQKPFSAGQDFTYTDMVWYAIASLEIIDEANFRQVMEDSLAKMASFRKNKKYYYGTCIKKDYDALYTKKKNLLYSYITTCNIPGDPEELALKKRDSILAWSTNRESVLIDYGFFTSLAISKQISFYCCDLGIHILQIIKQNWFGRLDGYMAKIGYDAESSTFSIVNKRNPDPLTADFTEDGKLTLYREHPYLVNGERQNFQTYVMTDSDMDYTNVIKDMSKEQRQQYAFAIATEKDWTMVSKPLVAEDAAIYQFLYNRIDLKAFENGMFTFYLKELYEFVHPGLSNRARQEDYERLLTHLKNIGMYRLRYIDSNGKEAVFLNLFEIRITRNEERLGSSKCIAWPSETTKSRVQALKDYIVLTKVYRDIPSPEHKLFFILLQTFRLQLKQNINHTRVHISRFESSLQQLDAMRPKRLEELITSYLNWFKDNQVLISNFEIVKVGHSKFVELDFLAFSELEKAIYNSSAYEWMLDSEVTEVPLMEQK